MRPPAETLLRELGVHARLTVYLAGAPGAGKTRRLLEEARALRHAGINVSVGWVETKGRPDLDSLAEGLPRIPPRSAEAGESAAQDFDLDAAILERPSTIVLDELEHTNAPGGSNAKRWQDALALRSAGISVIGALNVQHLETVAPIAERAIGFPIREIVPLSFLREADLVVAVDAPPDLIEARLRAGALVAKDDIERALAGSFKPQTLQVLRELMLRTLDELTVPVLRPSRVSTTLAIFDGKSDPTIFIRKCAAFAEATDLGLEVTAAGTPSDELKRIVRTTSAHIVDPLPLVRGRPDWSKAAATVIAVPSGEFGEAIASSAIDRIVFIADPTRLGSSEANPDLRARHPYGQTAGDRLRIGYGKFTVYLGAATGCGKTYAMLDRAHQMKAQGIDVVGALVETHDRPDTLRMLEDLEILPRKDGELDREALLARRPDVALIDELAHTNPPDSDYSKRYDEVLGIVRAGISVVTTLNIQHLEGLSDAVLRLTGERVQETLPDGILELADDVILIDAAPEILRERLRAGKIYPPDQIELALSRSFTLDNLTALRELAIRETMRARAPQRLAAPFSHLLLGVKARERDVALIERCARLASRLDVEFTVAHVAAPTSPAPTPAVNQLMKAAKTARASWHFEVSAKPAAALVALARRTSDAAIAVEGARSHRRFWHPHPFARQLVEAGAKELMLFSPAPFEPAS